jgi:hypothetical protein
MLKKETKVPTTKERVPWVVNFSDKSVYHVFAKNMVEATTLARTLIGKTTDEARVLNAEPWRKKNKPAPVPIPPTNNGPMVA